MEEQGQFNNSLEPEFQNQQSYNPVPPEGAIVGKKKMLLVIAIGVLSLGLISVAVYWQWANIENLFNNQTQPKDQIVNQDEQIKESEEISEEMDYSLKENLMLLGTCYLMKNPEDLKYFPLELLDILGYSDFFEISSEDTFFMEDFCQEFDTEAHEYFAYLIRTDEDNDGLNLYLEILFNTDDNNPDTDGDGFDDLTEVIHGYNPNDLWEAYIDDAYNQLALLGESDNLDIDKIIKTCNLLAFDEYSQIFPYLFPSYDIDKDMCLEQFSRTITDPSFCDKANFTPNSYSYKECKDNMRAHAAQTVDDCLKIENWVQREFCIENEVKKSKSLDPCVLLEADYEFENCVSSNAIYLENTADCYKYKHLMEDYNFDYCIQAVAFSTVDPLICQELVNESPFWCIKHMAYTNADPSICEYFALHSYDFNDCIQGTPDGRNIETEEDYFAFCNSYPENYTVAKGDKQRCFKDLSVKFNKEKYCKYSAGIQNEENTSGYKREEDLCYQAMILENERIDLCNLITNSQVLGNLNNQGYCLN